MQWELTFLQIDEAFNITNGINAAVEKHSKDFSHLQEAWLTS